jgi:hypothetical protein
MDTAVITDSRPRTVVSAQELRSWSAEEVAPTEFNCCGCQVRMNPKAVRPGMKVQAHFATWQNRTHLNCRLTDEVAAPDGILDRDANHPRGVLWPNNLIERRPRKVKGHDGSLDDGPDRRRTSRPSTPDTTSSRGVSTSTVAYSIRSFASAYLAMTGAERRATPITLPGVTDADRYQYAFKRLPQWNIEELGRRRVFHGPLRFTGHIERTDSSVRIELHAGAYERSSHRFTSPWTLVVDAAAMTSGQQSNLQNEFEGVASAAREGGLAPHVFALAEQNPAVLSELIVARRAYIAFLPAPHASRSIPST